MYKTFKEKLRSNEFSRNLTLVLSGNVTAKAIGILSAPIITRIYSPEDYGVFALFMGIVSIIGALSTLRYATAIPLIKNENALEAMLKLCFLMIAIVSAIACFVLLYYSDLFVVTFNAENIRSYLWFFPLAFFATGCYQTLSSWAIREKKFKIITQTTVTQSLSSSLSKILLGLLHLKPSGLLIGVIIQEAAGTFRLLKSMLRKYPLFFKRFNWGLVKSVAVRYKNFPLIQSWSQLLLALGAQLPVLLIGYLYDLKVAGAFGLAQSMISLPMNLIGQAVAQVYYAEIANMGKENPLEIYRLSAEVIKKMFIIGLFPVLFLLLFGPLTFKFVFGTEWKDAGVYSQILSLLILARFISTPVMSCLNVLEKQMLQLWINLFRVIFIVIVFCFASVLNFDVIEALFIYTITLSIYFLIVIKMVMSQLKKITKESV
ncbi:lipopolysaccharide biosynthesis protein [Aliidiomarina taiwanensis]|uniref:lipopolysaccharide biosynthesis protein n=1 Tax=Aliidiomarina taiwanensis TaxID=946228 RepID=UPI001300330A|nr:oligosaccharide flippase family protein [Aliidiomarina taiwanensis]